MTKGDKYYRTVTWTTGSGETKESTTGPFEYRDAQYFLDGLQSDMKGYCSGVKVRYWTYVYNEWEGPWKNTEFGFTV